MNGSTHGQGERYERSHDNVARLIVYFGPYLLWGTLGALLGFVFLVAG